MFEYHTYFERLKLKEPKGAYEYLVGDDWENVNKVLYSLVRIKGEYGTMC